MKQQQHSDRKARTRTFIQSGGLLHKSGLLEAFSIVPGDDLQDFENFKKATAFLGFLIDCFENNDFDEANLEQWKAMGERLMKGR